MGIVLSERRRHICHKGGFEKPFDKTTQEMRARSSPMESSLVPAGRVSGHHLLHSVRSGHRSFPRRHLLLAAEGSAGGALPLGAAEAAAGVARRSAAVQPWNLPVAAEPGRVPVHRPAGRLLHHHPLLPSVPLPARLPPLSVAQVSPGENITDTQDTLTRRKFWESSMCSFCQTWSNIKLLLPFLCSDLLGRRITFSLSVMMDEMSTHQWAHSRDVLFTAGCPISPITAHIIVLPCHLLTLNEHFGLWAAHKIQTHGIVDNLVSFLSVKNDGEQL